MRKNLSLLPETKGRFWTVLSETPSKYGRLLHKGKPDNTETVGYAGYVATAIMSLTRETVMPNYDFDDSVVDNGLNGFTKNMGIFDNCEINRTHMLAVQRRLIESVVAMLVVTCVVLLAQEKTLVRILWTEIIRAEVTELARAQTMVAWKQRHNGAMSDDSG
ncbi:hypothetical protein J6590_008509 [Homalodisca vitripennis]|nr:hypothetical protein J6590_008509 [Homalodisca vitripennis]